MPSHQFAIESSNGEDPVRVPTRPASAGLPLLPELCLEVYKYPPQLIYKKLPYLRQTEIDAYWPCFTLSSCLASTNCQLYSKFQVILPGIRLQDEPDIIFQLPLLYPVYEVFGIIDEIAMLDKLVGSDSAQWHGKEERLQTMISDFAVKQTNQGLQDYALLYEDFRLKRSPLPTSPRAADVALLTDFIREIVLRMRKTGRYVFHVRFIVDNYAAYMIQVIWHKAFENCRFTLSKPTKVGIQVQMSVAKKDSFTMAYLREVEEKLPDVSRPRLKWAEATEAE